MFLTILHTFITIGIIGLPYILPKEYLPYYILFVIMTFVQWALFNGDCIFTLLEDKNMAADPDSFVLGKLKLLGIDPKDKRVHYVLDMILYFGILTAFYRLDGIRGTIIFFMLLLTWIKYNGGYLNKWIS